MNCIYCYENIEEHTDMSKIIIEKSINFLSDMIDDTFFVNIHGGEPSINYDNMEYLINKFNKLSKERDISISYSLTTNGTFGTKKFIELIKTNNIDISVSIDGKSYTQNKNRKLKNNKDSFYIVDKFIDDLIHEKVIPRIRMTYNSSDIDYLYENILYFYKKGLRFVVAHHNSYDDWCLDDVYRLKKEIAKLKSFFYSNKDFNLNLIEPINNKPIGICNCGLDEINIYVNGDIYPCTWHTGDNIHKIGNVSKGIDINKRNELVNISKKINSECEGCDIYQLCENTRCKFINKSKTGYYDKVKPIDCLIKNVKFDCIGVKNNE
jgi:radical SAM domain protein